MAEYDVCGILSDRPDVRGYDEPQECSGCLRPVGHLGPHMHKTSDGKFICWEVNWGCDCDSCKSDEPDDWCIDYWPVESKDEIERLLHTDGYEDA